MNNRTFKFKTKKATQHTLWTTSFESESGSQVGFHRHTVLTERLWNNLQELKDELTELGFDFETIRFEIKLMVDP